jgi:hypothetical protein
MAKDRWGYLKKMTRIENLNLNKMGLMPLTETERNETNGGWWPIIGAYILLEAALNPSAHINAFKEGWNSVK